MSAINQIRCGFLGDEPVLICVRDNGHVEIWFTNDLDSKDPILLDNGLVSTWSLATACASGPRTCFSQRPSPEQQFLVAVGSNSHCITLWNLSNQNEKFNIAGHDHNIPCIDFSPCGRFLASASIDGTVRVWDVQTLTSDGPNHSIGKMIGCLRVCPEWGWAVRWLDQRFVKTIPSSNRPAWDAIHLLVDNSEYSLDYMSEDIANDEDEDGDDNDDAREVQPAPLVDSQIQDAPSGPIQAGGVLEPQCAQDQPQQQTWQSGDLLLYCSKHHLYLLDFHLNILSTLYLNSYHNFEAPPLWLNPLNRLSFLEVIPELSMAIVASQGDSGVYFVRIVRTEAQSGQQAQYSLVPEHLFPSRFLNIHPIIGVTLVRKESPNLKLLVRYLVYILANNRQLFIAELTSGNLDNDPVNITVRLI